MAAFVLILLALVFSPFYFKRAWELVFEGTFRRLTLMRMNKLIERVREYNPVSASSISEHHGLLPISKSEIERNTEAEQTQKPGF